jgi:hypothetical protein
MLRGRAPYLTVGKCAVRIQKQANKFPYLLRSGLTLEQPVKQLERYKTANSQSPANESYQYNPTRILGINVRFKYCHSQHSYGVSWCYGSTKELHLGRTPLKYWSGSISLEFFVILLSLFKRMLGKYLLKSHDTPPKTSNAHNPK